MNKLWTLTILCLTKLFRLHQMDFQGFSFRSSISRLKSIDSVSILFRSRCFFFVVAHFFHRSMKHQFFIVTFQQRKQDVGDNKKKRKQKKSSRERPSSFIQVLINDNEFSVVSLSHGMSFSLVLIWLSLLVLDNALFSVTKVQLFGVITSTGEMEWQIKRKQNKFERKKIRRNMMSRYSSAATAQ